MWASVHKKKPIKCALESRPLESRFRRLFFQAANKIEFRIEIIKEVKDKGFANHWQAGRTKLIAAVMAEHHMLQPG